MFLVGFYKFLETKLALQGKNEKEMIIFVLEKMHLSQPEMEGLVENGRVNQLSLMKKFSQNEFVQVYEKMLNKIEGDLKEQNEEKFDLFFQNLMKLAKNKNLEEIKLSKQLWEIMPLTTKTIEDIVTFASKLMTKFGNRIEIEDLE